MRLAALETNGDGAIKAPPAKAASAREAQEQDPPVASPVRTQLSQLEEAFSIGDQGESTPKLPRQVRAIILLGAATASWALVGGVVWLTARLVRG